MTVIAPKGTLEMKDSVLLNQFLFFFFFPQLLFFHSQQLLVRVRSSLMSDGNAERVREIR